MCEPLHAQHIGAHAGGTAGGDEANSTNSTSEEHGTIAQYIDKQLEKEFKEEEAATHERHDLNETLSKEKVRLMRLTA